MTAQRTEGTWPPAPEILFGLPAKTTVACEVCISEQPQGRATGLVVPRGETTAHAVPRGSVFSWNSRISRAISFTEA